MTHFITPFALFLFATAGAAQSETRLPVFGSWDCEIMDFTLDAETYTVSGKPGQVKRIEAIADDAYGVELTDSYRFGLFDVTAQTLIWHSPASGDTFECRRVGAG